VVEREVATAGVSAPGRGWSSCLWSPSPTRGSGCRHLLLNDSRRFYLRGCQGPVEQGVL